MKILQVGKFYPPYLGGIETVVSNLSEGLTAAGHEVTVLCSHIEARTLKETLRGVNVIRVPYYGKLFSQPLTPALFWRILKMSPQFDLVHFHLPNPLAEMAALFLNKKTTVVATYHADVTHLKFFLPVYHSLLNRFLNRADRIIAPTRAHITHSPILSKIETKDLKSKKFSIIPFGLDPLPWKDSPGVLEKANKLKTSYGRYFLFVGRLVEYKGVRFLIQALASVAQNTSDLNLVIIGDGPLKASLMDQVKDNPGNVDLSSRIFFRSDIKDHSDLVAHYHGCEFLVLPSISRQEAFGMVQLEAMACGKPVIASRLPTGVREVNLDGVTGLLTNPSDSASLAGAITELAGSDDLRESMGIAAKERFLSYYTVEAMTRAHLEAYLELLKAKDNEGR